MDSNIQHQLIKERERAALAQQVIDNPLVDEAYEKLLDKVWNDWRRSGPEEMDKRERCYMMIHVIEDVRKQFKQILTTGKWAEQQLEAEKDERTASKR